MCVLSIGEMVRIFWGQNVGASLVGAHKGCPYVLPPEKVQTRWLNGHKNLSGPQKGCITFYKKIIVIFSTLNRVEEEYPLQPVLARKVYLSNPKRSSGNALRR